MSEELGLPSLYDGLDVVVGGADKKSTCWCEMICHTISLVRVGMNMNGVESKQRCYQAPRRDEAC